MSNPITIRIIKNATTNGHGGAFVFNPMCEHVKFSQALNPLKKAIKWILVPRHKRCFLAFQFSNLYGTNLIDPIRVTVFLLWKSIVCFHKNISRPFQAHNTFLCCKLFTFYCLPFSSSSFSSICNLKFKHFKCLSNQEF